MLPHHGTDSRRDSLTGLIATAIDATDVPRPTSNPGDINVDCLQRAQKETLLGQFET